MRAPTPSADPARGAIDRRVLAWMGEPDAFDQPPDDERFEALASELFAHQFDRCEAYRRFCTARGSHPGRLGSWRQIPAVPTGAFKELALRSFPAERECHAFRTSGTSADARGVLHLDTLALYEASLEPSFRHHVWPELAAGERWPHPLRILAPSTDEAPDSSLSHMFATLLRVHRPPRSGFDLREGQLDLDTLRHATPEAWSRREPLSLCGSAFAFVHLVDALGSRDSELALPPGSRVMETGGFKGRARGLSRAELHASLARTLGIPESRIVNQYGMTELGSQFYDSTLRRSDEPVRKIAPPWTRVLVVDPETGDETSPNRDGVIVIFDLANTGSVFALQTADLGRRRPDGFEVLGRAPGAEARGCSIAADLMLGSDA